VVVKSLSLGETLESPRHPDRESSSGVLYGWLRRFRRRGSLSVAEKVEWFNGNTFPRTSASSRVFRVVLFSRSSLWLARFACDFYLFCIDPYVYAAVCTSLKNICRYTINVLKKDLSRTYFSEVKWNNRVRRVKNVQYILINLTAIYIVIH